MTIVATVFWDGLFVFAAIFFAVGIFKASWFRGNSRTTRGVLKAAIVAIIGILLFVVWWFIPPPDTVAILKKALRPDAAPSPTATATPTTVATPTPQLALTQPRPQRSPTEQAPTSASYPAYTSLPPSADRLARGAIHCEVIAHGIVVSKNANGTLYSATPSIAEAIVVAHNQKTKKDYRGATNSAGIVSLSVPPGLYFITASHPGFKESTFLSLARNVVVKDSEYASVTIYLEPLESPTP
jgi:hypothetical protein